MSYMDLRALQALFAWTLHESWRSYLLRAATAGIITMEEFRSVEAQYPQPIHNEVCKMQD